jgi:hypothetical protein
MTESRMIFEAIMKTKGHDDFTQTRGKYVNSGLQTRWIYFQLGWEMARATA